MCLKNLLFFLFSDGKCRENLANYNNKFHDTLFVVFFAQTLRQKLLQKAVNQQYLYVRKTLLFHLIITYEMLVNLYWSASISYVSCIYHGIYNLG